MKMSLRLFAFCMVCFCVSAVYAQYSPDNVKGKQFILQPTANDNRKVYVPYSDITIYYIHDSGNLFPVRKREPVTITGVNKKKDSTDVSFASANLGKGKIRIYGVMNAQMFSAVIKSAFSEPSETTVRPLYVANKTSGAAHYVGSNHLPHASDRVPVTDEELKSGKYKKCGICFYSLPKVSSYDLEMRLGEVTAGQVMMRYQLVTDDKIQNHVKAVGARVLSKWMMPLKGYKYKFYAVDSEAANAFASPAGKVYITTGLLDALESDEELEGIMAHEIAHVELRHGYRQFRSAQNAAAWGSLIAVMVGAYNQQVASFATMVTELASNIVLSGHSRRYESEADSMAFIYFESNKLGKGSVSFRNVLRKLQYNQDYYQPDKTTPSLLASHPDIEERIDAIERSSMQVFGVEDVFYGYNSEGEQVATLSFQTQRVYRGTVNDDDVGLQVIALIETTSALEERDRIKGIVLATEAGNITMENKENTEIIPNDAVGASFISKTQKSLIGRIGAVDLKLKNVVKWEPRR